MKHLLRLFTSYFIGAFLLIIPTFSGSTKPTPDTIGISVKYLTPMPPQDLKIAEVEPLLAYSNPNNTYAWGNCTRFVSDMRPDLPQDLGNAITWLANAKAEGFDTGTIPRKNAVAWFNVGWLGHVALVEKVYPQDDTILIKEMNVEGLNVTDERVIPADSVKYIY